MHDTTAAAAPSPGATGGPLLGVDDATVDYGGVHAVRGVSLQVAPGEAVAVPGANGAGKTSLLHAISGLVPLAGGRVRIDGHDVTGARPEQIARRGLAHVPDDRGIFDDLTVAENLTTALYGVGRHRDPDAGAALDEVLDLFPILADRWSQTAGTMSGGQQQMLTIARALVQRPRLLMIDEMSMGLAPAIVDDLFEVVGRLADAGIGVLLVEQFVGQALAVVDRALVMAGGRVVAAGTADEIAADDVAAHYLGGGEADGAPADAPSAITLPRSETLPVALDARQIRRLQARAAAEGDDPEALLARLVDAALGDTPATDDGGPA